MATGIDAVYAQLLALIFCERGNFRALSRVTIELPAVIAALDLFAIELPVGKRDAAMGAGIAQGKGFSVCIPSNDQRQAEKLGLCHAVPPDLNSRQCPVPKAVEQQRIWRLPLRGFGFGGVGEIGRVWHQDRFEYCQTTMIGYVANSQTPRPGAKNATRMGHPVAWIAEMRVGLTGQPTTCGGGDESWPCYNSACQRTEVNISSWTAGGGRPHVCAGQSSVRDGVNFQRETHVSPV